MPHATLARRGEETFVKWTPIFARTFGCKGLATGRILRRNRKRRCKVAWISVLCEAEFFDKGIRPHSHLWHEKVLRVVLGFINWLHCSYRGGHWLEEFPTSTLKYKVLYSNFEKQSNSPSKRESMLTQNKRLGLIMLTVVVLLLTPLIAMQFTKEVAWSPSDFMIAGVLLLGTGLACEAVLRKVKKTRSRLAICGAILLGLILVWMELAVGVFGTPFAGS